MIIRTEILNFLLNSFKGIKSPKIVELIGKPGVGKSTVIPQIITHFF